MKHHGTRVVTCPETKGPAAVRLDIAHATQSAASKCALCGRDIGEVHWVEHRPALLTPGRETIEWSQLPAKDLPRVLATHQRVCWSCHVSNALREPLPGLVIEQPEARAGRS